MRRTILALLCSLALAATVPPGKGSAARESEPDSSHVTALDDLDEFVPGDGAQWDSVLAAYDTSVRKDRRATILPRYGLRYNKAEEVHLELGGSLAAPRYRVSELDLRFGYDTGRERPNVFGELRGSLSKDDRWFVEFFGADDAVPFGQHRPYGNTWLALFGGYDAVSYMREREFGAGIGWRVSEERQAWLGWVRTEQDALTVVSDAHLFGRDAWMEQNEEAEPFLGDGVRVKVRRAPRYHG